MSGPNGAVAEQIESIRNKGPEQGTDEKAGKKAPGSKVKGFFKAPDEDDEKVLKWRFLAKGPALDAILAVFGAAPVEGDKQVAFKVEEAGDLELGEVVRHVFIRAHAAGVKLEDLIALIEEREAKMEAGK